VSVPKAINFLSLVKRCSRKAPGWFAGNSLKGSNQFNPAILGTSVFRMALLSVQRTRPIKMDPFDTPSEDSNLKLKDLELLALWKLSVVNGPKFGSPVLDDFRTHPTDELRLTSTI